MGKMSREEVREYLQLNAGKVDRAIMGRQTGWKVTTLNAMALNMGLNLALTSLKHRRETVDETIRKYASTKSIREMAEMLDVGIELIRYRAKRLDIPVYFRMEDHRKEKRFSKMVRGEEVFNLKAYSNWLIG